MDIAVTGSTGLIGSALVAHLRSKGHRVLRLVRSAPTDGPDTDTAKWDPAAGTIDAGALEGIDAVVHLAGESIAERRWTPEQKERIRSSRERTTTLLTTTLSALASPPRTLLSGSAIGIYGDTGATVTDETGPLGSDFLASVCIDWEEAARPAAEAGIRTVFLRTGIVLSAEGGALAKQLPFFKFGLGGKLGSGRQYQSWISLDDHIAATTWLLDGKTSGPVNLTAPEPVTNAEFTKALGRQLHRPTTIIPLIGPRTLYGRELVDALLLTSQRVVPKVLLDGGFRFTHTKLEDALQQLV